ncbi:MAG: hypothetical protein EA361_13130 [Bacteroidetes bacterium]|nr:MAG: hypothetical protein EA361_13130 [Bacteroidota bacterium]
MFFCAVGLWAQSASVSPSRVYYNAEPGQTQVRQLTITNNSESPQNFTITFSDFASPGTDGKTELMEPGENVNSASQWLSASPSFVELQSGESRDVDVILQVPNIPEARRVVWSSALVKLARERTDAPGLGNDAMGFGIMHTFQFVVHIFQTPRSVTYRNARILAFEEGERGAEGERRIRIHVENTGDAIIDVAAYLELTNMRTGESRREKARAFTTLPGHSRVIHFELPDDLGPGRYSVLGVVDYGDRDAVIAAELELTVGE